MNRFPIVGLGSSAGGLEALQKFFKALPGDRGLAYVVAAPLDPSQGSRLAGLLRRHTAMPVIEVTGRITVKPNHVYVMAPNQELLLKNGTLHPREPVVPRGQRRAIDHFFQSLAEDQGEQAIAILLSGMGDNGSQGLRFIKALGGSTLAQDPKSAADQDMPRSAIATGLVDLVLTPEAMPSALLGLIRHADQQSRQSVKDTTADSQLTTLLALLRARTKQAFWCYQRQTLLRRIYRRMGLYQIEQLGDYVERLRKDPEEVTALARDLTIKVTGFFRDPEAWQMLGEKVVTPLLAERPTGAPIRIWVPGCATGEEAYSHAIMLHEGAAAVCKTFDITIFATDLAQDALSIARVGLYPGTISDDVGQDRLQRFFDTEDGRYRIKNELRELVVFAPQNLLPDPPFSRLDLISCRNLLICLEPEVQKKILAVFQFALNQDGHLFLGTAETISGSEAMFQPVSPKWRIYRRSGAAIDKSVEFPVIGAQLGALAVGSAANPEPSVPGRASLVAQRALLERYAPASVLLDRRFQVHYVHGPVENYLGLPSREPTHDLLAMARQGLRAPLRAAVRTAIDDEQEVTINARVRRGQSYYPIRATVAPLGPVRNGGDWLVVSFFERDILPSADLPTQLDEREVNDQLRAELSSTRAELRLTVERMAAAHEELQASNDALELSKVELQSLNEALNTVNLQLQAKVEQLEARTNDLNNLLTGTGVATLVIDATLRIRWFTPAMQGLLDLLATDIGRPVDHLAPKFTGQDFVEDARRSLHYQKPVVAEIQSTEGRCYLRRITPYRIEDNRIDGVTVTLIDITDCKTWEKQLLEATGFADQIIDAVRCPLLVLDSDLRVMSANEAFYSKFQIAPVATEGQLIYELGNRQWDIPELRRLLAELLPRQQELRDYEVSDDFTMIGERIMLLNARPIDQLQSILLAIEDITERRRGEQAQQLLIDELNHRVRNTLAIVDAIAAQTLDHSASLDAFRPAFEGRIQALASTHTLLAGGRWSGSTFDQLIERQLAPYLDDWARVGPLSGPKILVRPKPALTLSLVFHELAANAAKYGSLSNQHGQLEIAWQILDRAGGRAVHLVWTESNGPAVETPRRHGFGTELIDFAIVHEFGGEAQLDYRDEGLICKLTLPLAGLDDRL